MEKVTRFAISIEDDLLDKFEKQIKKKGAQNRSEAIRDLIREYLISREWSDPKQEVAGTITLVYDHHKSEILKKLTSLQHEYGRMIVSTTHIHLDHDNCLEVLVVKGKAGEVRKMADKISGLKGIKFGDLSTATTGKSLT